MDRTAERGYSLCASSYVRARPGFPAAAIDWVAETVQLTSSTPIVELGAGTGTLTSLLVARSLDVVAIEPVAEMRQALTRSVPGAPVLDGTAERIPIETDRAAAVMAANAMHWFELDRALPEIHRALRPAGALVLLWAFRDVADPTQAMLERMARSLPHDGPIYPGRRWREELAASNLFTVRAERAFPYCQQLSEEGVIELVSSWSIVGALPPKARERVLDEARDLVRGRGTLPLAYRIEIQIYESV